jgi:hypothetical protein
MLKCIILKNNLVGLTAKGRNFDEFQSGGPHEKHAVATWNLGTISAFSCKQGKTKKPCVEMAGHRNFLMHNDF